MKAKMYCIFTIIFTVLFSFSHGQETSVNYNIRILNTVWNTMNEDYFDTTFNGLDWQKEYDYYKPIVESCKTKDSLFFYLNQMVFKLNVSHLGLIPAEEANESGDPQLYFDGMAGLQIRYIDNEAVIISVKKNSAAEKAGIRPGFTITKLNGRTIDSFVREKMENPTPPFNDRNFRSLIAQNINRVFYGEPGDKINVTFKDGNKVRHNAILCLEDRKSNKTEVIPGMPPMYADITHRLINDSTAYIHFDAFLPQVLDSILASINNYKPCSCIILDLRGNPGGLFDVRKTLAEQFVSDSTLFWRYHRRGMVDDVYLFPSPDPYKGKLIILIDELSTSSSEEFAGGMKAIGRATLVGRQTPGKVLTMEVVPLPEGAFFIYPNQQTLTSKNEVLEANGVVPDVIVKLNKRSLLNGIDNQLMFAIELSINANVE
jgi:carboxyl-terminal processing protease